MADNELITSDVEICAVHSTSCQWFMRISLTCNLELHAELIGCNAHYGITMSDFYEDFQPGNYLPIGLLAVQPLSQRGRIVVHTH